LAGIKAKIERGLAEISSEVGSSAAPRDYSAAQPAVLKIERAAELDEAALAPLASDRRYEETIAGLSVLSKIPFKIMDRFPKADIRQHE